MLLMLKFLKPMKFNEIKQRLQKMIVYVYEHFPITCNSLIICMQITLIDLPVSMFVHFSIYEYHHDNNMRINRLILS